MDRLVLLVFAFVAQVGCQTPYYPFGVPQTRVPPPPTGVIGSGDYDQGAGYSTPYSAPNPYQNSSYILPAQVPGEQITDVGPWRYWESAGEQRPACLLYTSPSPRDQRGSRMPSSA